MQISCSHRSTDAHRAAASAASCRVGPARRGGGGLRGGGGGGGASGSGTGRGALSDSWNGAAFVTLRVSLTSNLALAAAAANAKFEVKLTRKVTKAAPFQLSESAPRPVPEPEAPPPPPPPRKPPPPRRAGPTRQEAALAAARCASVLRWLHDICMHTLPPESTSRTGGGARRRSVRTRAAMAAR